MNERQDPDFSYALIDEGVVDRELSKCRARAPWGNAGNAGDAGTPEGGCIAL